MVTEQCRSGSDENAGVPGRAWTARDAPALPPPVRSCKVCHTLFEPVCSTQAINAPGRLRAAAARGAPRPGTVLGGPGRSDHERFCSKACRRIGSRHEA